MNFKKYFFITVFVLTGFMGFSQTQTVTLTGIIKDKTEHKALPFVNIVIKSSEDNSFVSGTITDEEGRFSLVELKSGNYSIVISYIGFQTVTQSILVGKLSSFLDLGTIELEEDSKKLGEVVVTGEQDQVLEQLDKKTFKLEDNFSQSGGSVLQAMKNLPGITVDQNGKVQLRGSDKIMVLIDGRQTALTGFGSQAGLDNIPASAIERIEIINNPSAKYDANGNAGIINIIYKKNLKEGFNGKIGLTLGLGALWQKQSNLPTIRAQYQDNPKINPSLSFNYRKKKTNIFFQGDVLWQKALNKNEFFQRRYDDGSVINQQFLENRTQLAFTVKTGLDWAINEYNSFTISALYNREGHIDRGDLPYFNTDFSERKRLWLYYEDEVNTSVNVSTVFQHKFKQAGHLMNINLNYTFHREDEKFYFTNILSLSTSEDTTKLIADENVSDLNIDYIKPLRHGRVEFGTKLRWRYIPTQMTFLPGNNSVLDLTAAGWANYNEVITAIYTNYVFESKHIEVEAGLRVEYAKVDYTVIPTHPTYKSNGYNYIQPFPNFRFAYLINENNRISFFYNRRVDRPDEYDLRIFPKYDDPEILKTGNPALRPQYTQTVEVGYKTSWAKGYIYSAVYHRMTENILTRVFTAPVNNTFINSISQNAGNGYNTGIELVFSQIINKAISFNFNLNGYQNIISAFKIENLYPFNVSFSADQQQNYSGNAKFNGLFHFKNNWDIQLTGIYLAPDIVPQGKIDARYSVDLGVKKSLQKGSGELFMNISDIFNTFKIKKSIQSEGFLLSSTDFYETQVFRVGYNYKF